MVGYIHPKYKINIIVSPLCFLTQLTHSKSLTDLTSLPTNPSYLQSSTKFQFPSADSRIIRVSLGDDSLCNGYKSIVVSNPNIKVFFIFFAVKTSYVSFNPEHV